MTDTINEKLMAAMIEHSRVELESGFIGCDCGWEPNQPRKWSEKQSAAQADSDQPDPIEPEGDYDTDHISDEPWLEHVAGVQQAIVLASE